MRLAAKQSGGAADVEPFDARGCRSERFERGFKASKLFGGDATVGLVGREEMGHHAFKEQRRIGGEALEHSGGFLGCNALAAHAGVDFKMNRNRLWICAG